VDRVRQIVEFWGEDEGVEMARVVERSRLYGATPSEVVKPPLEKIRVRTVRGGFVATLSLYFLEGRPRISRVSEGVATSLPYSFAMRTIRSTNWLFFFTSSPRL